MTFVPWKNRKVVAKDLRAVYSAPNEQKAEEALAVFEQTYQNSYPTVAQLWRRNWHNIIPIFNYPADIRRAIYTTNVIESLNYSLKKPLKTKGAFPTEDALLKVLYLAINKASEKWTMPIRDWRKALNWFAQLFGARLLDRLSTQKIEETLKISVRSRGGGYSNVHTWFKKLAATPPHCKVCPDFCSFDPR